MKYLEMFLFIALLITGAILILSQQLGNMIIGMIFIFLSGMLAIYRILS